MVSRRMDASRYSNPVSTGHGGVTRVFTAALCLLATALATYVCLRIEVLNLRAGSLLPRQADAAGHLPKWRLGNERAIRRHMIDGYRRESGHDGPQFNLTASQQRQIDEAVERAVCEEALRRFVSTWGLAQHVIAPTALALCILVALIWRTRRTLVLASIAACPIVWALAMMMHRRYLLSLGW